MSINHKCVVSASTILVLVALFTTMSMDDSSGADPSTNIEIGDVYFLELSTADSLDDWNPDVRSVEEVRIIARSKWDVYIDQFEVGMDELSVHKKMEGKYRDKGTLYPGGSGDYIVLYLVDDFHQVEFSFALLGRLQTVAITPRRQWIRFPDGSIARGRQLGAPPEN